MTKDNDFDFLKYLASMADEELQTLFSKATVERIERLAFLLQRRHESSQLGTANFVKTVRELHNLYKTGSRALGQAIIEASDYAQQGHIEQAKNVYYSFIETCPSEFYRRIAEHQIKALEQ